MTQRRNPGCAFGPCNNSAQVGGAGCYLCDVIARLPQKGRGATVEEVPDGGTDGEMTLRPVAVDDTKKAKKGAAPRKVVRSKPLGRLFE